MDERQRFYKARDSRSRAYLARELPVEAQVQVHLPQSIAESPSGQVAVLALANQLVRFHRRVHFVAPDVKLAANSVFGGDTLLAELRAMVTAIDPHGDFTFDSRFVQATATVSLGSSVDTGAEIYAHWDHWVGGLSPEPRGAEVAPETSVYGAATASVLSAAAVLQLVAGSGYVDHKVSLWNFRADAKAAVGPVSVQPLDLGKVLMIGAGGVGSCLSYWLALLGHDSEWTVVDKDLVTVSSTNRGMPFTAEDARWPEAAGKFKADIVAHMLGDRAVPSRKWFHDWTHEDDYDLALCLANDHGVRTAINHFPVPVVLQATTGTEYLAQLHRHVAGKDECVHCRMSDVREVEFTCGEATVDTEAGERIDAALPFVAAAAGLQLVGALHRLAEGDFHKLNRNVWRWHLGLHHRVSSGSRRGFCGCPYVPAPRLRQELYAHSKFAELAHT